MSDELAITISENFGISRSESRRLVSQGGVRNEQGEKIQSIDEIEDGETIKVGRKASMKIKKN